MRRLLDIKKPGHGLDFHRIAIEFVLLCFVIVVVVVVYKTESALMLLLLLKQQAQMIQKT